MLIHNYPKTVIPISSYVLIASFTYPIISFDAHISSLVNKASYCVNIARKNCL